MIKGFNICTVSVVLVGSIMILIISVTVYQNPVIILASGRIHVWLVGKKKTANNNRFMNMIIMPLAPK